MQPQRGIAKNFNDMWIVLRAKKSIEDKKFKVF